MTSGRTPSAAAKPIIAGWSRKRLASGPGLVLDVGSGAYPNAAADILCDGEMDDDRHRHGRSLVLDDRPFVVARVEALPFRSKAFAFVIASHIAEHVEAPDDFCRELSRVAEAGYVETPSPLADYLLHEDYHLWRVGRPKGVLTFRAKPPRTARSQKRTDRFYRFFYAGRGDCSRPTASLPDGMPGRLAALALRALGAGLNRLGIMHTRYDFDPEHPLRHRVIS